MDEDERVGELYDDVTKEKTGVVIYHTKTQSGHTFRIRRADEPAPFNEIRSLDYVAGLNLIIKKAEGA